MSEELDPRKVGKNKSKLKNPRRTTEADRIITSQMWKANQVARKIGSFTGLPYEELRDVALEHIVRLYKTWDPEKGANFSTWVNRNLQFHMLNYLRDHSRMVRIPRSYSDLYLKIRKHLLEDPSMLDVDIASKIGVSAKRVGQVRKAFAMSFTELTDHSELVEDRIEDDSSLETLFSTNRELLFNIASLAETDEEFLTDVLIRKRTTATILRKNPDVKNPNEISKKTNSLVKQILCLKQDTST